MIGTKLRELRLSKGYSQEELAFRSNVNLRTIQRIEKDENSPRGKTLQLLCETLEVNVEDLLDYGKREDPSVLSVLYFSVLIGIVVPLGNVIGPLFFLVIYKDKVKEVSDIGKRVVVFQLFYSIIVGGLLVLWVLAKILKENNYHLVLLIAMLIVAFYNYGRAIYIGVKIRSIK